MNPKISLLCARACELSYKDFKSRSFNAGVVKLGFDDFATFERAGVEAFCMSNQNTIVVCFRGTDSKPDFLADAMTSKTVLRLPNQKVHTGFLRTLMIVEQDVFNFCIERVAGGKRKLYVTGHSLGAAMGVLFSMRFFEEDVNGVVTFGCPRVGNEAFAKAFNAQHGAHSLRFVNNNDVVARLPMKCLGNSHVFRLQRFDRRGKLHSNFRPSRGWKFWDSFAGRIRNLARLKISDGVSDHSMSEYRRLVEKSAPKS